MTALVMEAIDLGYPLKKIIEARAEGHHDQAHTQVSLKKTFAFKASGRGYKRTRQGDQPSLQPQNFSHPLVLEERESLVKPTNMLKPVA
jgi:hypothetical protein